MKIKRVTAIPLQYPEPHDHGKLRCITLARVEAADGTVGWGEAISQFPESAVATGVLIEQGFAPSLVGEDAREVERLWHKMLDRAWWYGPHGIAAFAISAIDVALWDLKGKALGLPVCSLLGGMLQPRVLAMASIHLDMDDLDWNIREFGLFREQGYRVVKGGWGKRAESVFGMNRKRDLALAKAVRQSIGDDVELVFDVLGARVKWDVPTAVTRVRDLEEVNLKWIEEPLPPHDLSAHARLRSSVQTKIGTGEQEWNVEGYRRLIASGGVDVVQLDPGRCLGLTGCRNVVRLIEAANLHFSAHTWSSAVNTAASVQLIASSRHGLCMDFKPHESPMQHELVTRPWRQEQGYLAVPNLPGLGIEVREDVTRRYALTSNVQARSA